MPRYLKTNLDPDGKILRIDAAVRSKDGTHFLVLHRLPPHYEKPPTFVVRLTEERMQIRGRDTRELYRAYALQEFTDSEIEYLRSLRTGVTHAPFFNFSYPNVLKRMGKLIYVLTDAEVAQIADQRGFKLVAGER